MPINISLSSYTLRVKEHSNDTFVKMNEINKKDDMKDILESFLRFYKVNVSDESDKQKIFQIFRFGKEDNITINSTKYRIFNGIVKTGNYGFESEIYNKKTKSISYKRQKEDAELIPFYFLIALPIDKDEGIVLLQGFKQYGIKTIFEETLDKYISGETPGYKIELNNLVDENFIKILLDEGITSKIRYIKYEQPVNIEDACEIDGDHEEFPDKLHAELSVYSGGSMCLSQIMKVVKNHLPYHKSNDGDSLSKLIEITDFEYDAVKIEIKIHDKKRTIDLSNLDKLRPILDITDEVERENSEHPEFDSINQIAIDLCIHLAKGLKIGNKYTN